MKDLFTKIMYVIKLTRKYAKQRFWMLHIKKKRKWKSNEAVQNNPKKKKPEEKK